MAEISSYVDPGVYVSEVITPGSVSLTSDRVLCIVGIAPRTRRATDEAIVRGSIFEESLTVSSTSPYRATLINASNRNRTQCTLRMNDSELGLGEWSFVSAYLDGAEWAGATVDMSILSDLTLSLDGKDPITMDVSAQIVANGGAPGTADADDVCDAINDLLVASATYGAAYASAASHYTGTANEIIRISSPITTSSSDVKVLLSLEDDCASVISNTAWVPLATAGVQAPTLVEISSVAYSSSATYEIDYVSIETQVDPLENADATNPLSDIIRAGSSAGSSNFVKDTDFEVNGNTIDWETASSADASITSIDGPFAIVAATNDEIRLAINDLDPITITLTAGGAQTAADLVDDINFALTASSTYGPLYSHVASVSGLGVLLTVPKPFENLPAANGSATSITLYDSTATGITTVFGIATSSLPYESEGTGDRPSFGSVYYCSYDYTRPSEDYDLPQRVYDVDGLYEYTSPLTISNYTRNHLAIAGEVAFQNGAPSLWIMQINDSTAPGTPTLNQIRAAIDLCAEKSGITDVVVLDTSTEIATYLQNHVSSQSSMMEKNYRRGWYGMARDTEVGDPDTPDTFVYRSTVTLQPGSNSPGRGRQILVAPANADRIITLEDGREVTLELDGSYQACAVAAINTGLGNPSDALMGKLVQGFEIDNYETYLRGERYTLAENGVTVITMEGGRFELKDPLTTESGGLVAFEEPSASAQKDAVTRAVETIVDSNLKGQVPSNLSDFISDIRQWVAIAIQSQINAGVIGNYTDDNGAPRNIDPASDIKAQQSSTDPRSFTFKFWYNLKYPAKRFFGEYSVDNPFF